MSTHNHDTETFGDQLCGPVEYEAPMMAVLTTLAPIFTPEEERALCALRARLSPMGDLFDNAELRRLHFLRWLYQSGYLVL